MTRLTAKELGQRGEDLAARYLVSKEYQIVERNWRCQFGEIDIIALQEEIMVFVEVKSRRGDAFGSAVESVSLAKEKRLLATGEFYMMENDLENVWWRIDIIAIQFSQYDEIESITQLEDAVRVDGN